ncbi:hypothetical protein AKN93_01875 [Thiopseudomonas alkaliphila]|uniref:hypothetical protein n=1 Tax=Thiopseudomonas alkaliphila TaxID=1697053 RepID=UPI00069F2D31|nr:hypothetical protein [Thiopseudomonas alkaliphila]AKX47498.1 hypothetical protein AKN94_09135 [Thiopseudomonas alkaliphila]AKX48295.1 hypothetical protein AKN93_01875 [Thiopseudomonas alkaliphila]AKX53424.1 hypothetical protein AKN91_06890 [Thiopseudomonas alkaliphila]
MRKLGLFLGGLALTLVMSVQAEPVTSLQVVFQHYRFNAPLNPLFVAQPHADLLLLKYSTAKGKQYLAFSKEPELDPACKLATLLNQFNQPELLSEGCQAVRKSFSATFKAHPSLPFKLGQQPEFYAFSSAGNSFLFSPLATGGALKIDTDFLTDQQLKQLLAH